jgi:hypothetical protein
MRLSPVRPLRDCESPAVYGAGAELAIDRGWLRTDKSGVHLYSRMGTHFSYKSLGP